jgi:predicted nucleic acid-binding protein
MYLFDSNAFMEAARLYYSFNIAPGYWDWLVEKHKANEIASITSVYDEITAGEGDLVDWAKDSALDGFWLPDTDQSIVATAELAAWANHADRPFRQSAVDEFMGSADLRLAAQASAIGATVVTRETSEPGCKKRVKLPDAAKAVGVKCVQPFVAYERLGLTLS